MRYRSRFRRRGGLSRRRYHVRQARRHLRKARIRIGYRM